MRDLFGSYPEGGSIAAASNWLEALLRGQVITIIAVLGVALLGYELLMGRISAKRAGRVVLGCFILLGSPAIALGVIGTTRDTTPAISPIRFETPPPMVLPSLPPEKSGNPFDPYVNTLPPN